MLICTLMDACCLQKHDEEERKKLEAEVNEKRLAKARDLMKKLSKTDTLIKELVTHTIHVAAAAPHTPGPEEGD
jgi:hypothetical protein